MRLNISPNNRSTAIAVKISGSGNGIEQSYAENKPEKGNSQSEDGLFLGLWVDSTITYRISESLNYTIHLNTDLFLRMKLKRVKGIY